VLRLGLFKLNGASKWIHEASRMCVLFGNALHQPLLEAEV
jgi:hypothetical protein